MEDQEKSDYLLAGQELNNTAHNSQRLYQSSIATAQEGMVLQFADGSIQAYNASAERILGLTDKQIQDWTALHSSWQFVDENGSPLSAENYPSRVAWATGKPCFNVVIGLHQPKGELTWLLMNSQPLFRVNETVAYAVVSTFNEITGDKRASQERVIWATSKDQLDDNISTLMLNLTERKQMEEALKESELRFRQLMDSNIIGIVLADWEKITEANDVFLQMVGYTREDLLAGKIYWRQMTPPEYSHLDRQSLQELLTLGCFTAFEKQYIRKDGSRVSILIGGALLQQSPASCVCFVMDLTEHKQVEKSLRDALLRLTFHVENSPLAVIEWDHEFRISRWSREAERIFGWQAQEVIGKRFNDWQFISAEDETTVNDIISRIFSGSETQVVSRNRNYTKDGSIVFCEWYNSALSDESGQLISVLSQVLDVTDRQRVEVEREQMLRRSRQYANQLHGLTEAALAINSALSIEELLQLITQQARTIIGAHQSIISMTIDYNWAQSITSISLSDKYAAWRDYDVKSDGSGIYACVCQTNRPMRMTQAELVAHPRWRGFGQEADKHPPMRGWLAAPLIGRDGHNIGLIQLSDKYEGEFTQEDEAIIVQLAQMASTAIENTRLYAAEKRARNQAEEANCIKDEFLAVLSHELRSPLNPILGWSKLLQSRKLDESKIALALSTIERNAKLQAQLIEDLLDVSRILQGKITLNVETVNLVSTIAAALESVSLAAEVKSIEVSLLLVPLPPTGDALGNATFLVMGDANRLQQVVWNLLSNAVKFTPSGGRVEVRLEHIDSYAQIQVIDTGKGINPEFLPHVFDYFRQADSTTTRNFGGLGLGLAIVRQLVELHGGTVLAASPGEGLGATFTVRLPLLHTQAVTGDSQQEGEIEANVSNLDGLKILVVDDDTDSRDFISFVLEEEGAEVIAVSSAQKALQALAEFRVDVLLSDIGMPEIDGYKLIRQIRTQLEQGREIPAIALTAYAGEYNQQQALSAGFQMHITKPTDPSELVAAVARLAKKFGHQ